MFGRGERGRQGKRGPRFHSVDSNALECGESNGVQVDSKQPANSCEGSLLTTNVTPETSESSSGSPFGHSDSLIRGLAYGVVNGILLPPILVSFAAIIFRDSAFGPFLPRLVKLTLFSGGVHQACFSSLSGLPFAVGSVQDAGLIFLSAIASTVVAFGREKGIDSNEMISTVCFVLCSCTAILGAALVAVGHLRLASVVQYLPMPVVGGYLAYIGYFCGQAGLGFVAGIDIKGLQDLYLLAEPRALGLALPTVGAGLVLFLCLRRFPSVLTLPLLMVAILVAFFSTLALTGTSLEEARVLGWISEESPSLPWTEAWSFFDISSVRWGVFIRVMPNLLAMTLVVAFSSCLDIAAIEMEMGSPLDYDRELKTVGWSNLVSGLCGGFTGSYIFSQTIFNLRGGIKTRMAGVVTLLMILSVAMLPVNITSYVPKAFFGSLLVLISLDLMIEWLWESRRRMMPAEYSVCLFTFAAVQWLGVEEGMLLGVLAAMVSFAVAYAQIPGVVKARVKGSTIMRTFEERVVLQLYRKQMVTLELEGYIFFGSAIKIHDEVKRWIVWGETKKALGPFAHSENPHLHINMASHPENGQGRGDDTAGHGYGYNNGSNSGRIDVGHSSRGWGKTRGQGRGNSNLRSCWTGNFYVDSPRGKKSPMTKMPVRGIKQGGSANGSAGLTSDLEFRYEKELDEEKNSVQEYMVRWASPDPGSWLPSTPIPNSPCLSEAKTEAGLARSTPPTSVAVRSTALCEMRDNGGEADVEDSDREFLEDSECDNQSKRYIDDQTRRVILDFSRVVGIDATAARTCFLMLKRTLEVEGVDVLFAGVKPRVLVVLRAHGVVGSDDPLFGSLDSALEWSEEQLLSETNIAAVNATLDDQHVGPHPHSLKSHSSSLSAPPSALINSTHSYGAMSNSLAHSGTNGTHLKVPSFPAREHRGDDSDGREVLLDEVSSEQDPHSSDQMEQREAYYARASFLRRRSSTFESSEDMDPSMEAEDIGTLQSILEDYLEVDRYKAPPGMLKLLGEAKLFFRKELSHAGEMLLCENQASDRLRFIAKGAVELQVQRESGPRRLLRVCAGGTFGEMGFYLKHAQPFRAIALEPCHLFTLNRVDMARMQEKKPLLCTLVQKAVLKSMCLAASFGMESAHIGPIDN